MTQIRKHVPISLLAKFLFGVLVVFMLFSAATSVFWVKDIQILHSEWSQHERGVARKSVFLNLMRGSLGYDGLIHSLKNYLLRGDEKYLIRANTSILELKMAISGFRTVGVTDKEAGELELIERSVAEYERSIKIAEKLMVEGHSIHYIDQKVQVDDSQMIASINGINSSLIVLRRKNTNLIDDQINKIINQFSISFGALGGLLFIIFGAIVWFVDSRIVFPLSKISQAFEHIDPARGSETRLPLRNVGWHDEFDQVVDSGNRFLDAVSNELKERRLAEQSERKNGQYVSAVIESSAEAIITIDDKGLIETFNPASEKMFNYRSSEVIGKNVSMLMPSTERDHHQRYIDNSNIVSPTIINRARDLQGITQDNKLFPMELTVSPMRLEGQIKFIGIMRDITERKHLEKVKEEFISTVSHELRTPLTAIIGSIGLVHSGVFGQLEPQAQEIMEIALQNSTRLNLLVNDLLDLEKLQTGQIALKMSDVNLNDLIKQSLVTMKTYAERYSITYEFTDFSEDLTVRCDVDRINQVLANLLSNAAKFSPIGGAIVVTITKPVDAVRISVTDKGVGIAEEFHASLFERFTQADSSDTRQKGGTGLGLSISKSIVDLHRGRIGFETEVGQGSTFYLELPLTA